MSHIERRQKEKEEIKQRILEAARKIAAKEGWHSLTIRKIAEEIEYTPPIVYEHFENKEDLIREIVYTGFNMLSKEFASARESESDPKKIIHILSLIHWNFAFNNVELYQLMFSLERPNPTEEMVANFKLIEEAFLELIHDKEALHEIIFSWMCFISGAISIVMRFPNLPHQEGKDPKKLFVRMIDRFIEGL
jgi:AcrR family transcriptional regulator